MSDSSAELLGGSGKYSNSRDGSPRVLKEVSSEEDESPRKTNAPVKTASGSGVPKLKAKGQSNNVSTNSNFFGTAFGSKPSVGSGTKGGKLTSRAQLSATIIESTSSSESDPPGPSVFSKKKRETDNDNDIRYPLIDKDVGENSSGRNTDKKPGSLKRKQTLKARTNATTTTTTTTTTTITTTTTGTTKPVYTAPSSSGREVESSLSQGSKRKSNADTKAKRLSYIASSVQTDQQSVAAVKKGESISSLPIKDQKGAFEETLKLIEELRPSNRCAALVKLGLVLSLFDPKDQAVYLPRLRKLASAPMPEQDRRKVIEALVCAVAANGEVSSNDDDNDDDSEGSGIGQAYPPDDGANLKKFQDAVARLKVNVQGLNRRGQGATAQDIDVAVENAAAFKYMFLQLEFLSAFLDELGNYHDDDKKNNLILLLKKFGVPMVFGALLRSALMVELQNAADINMPISTLLLGVNENSQDIVEYLVKFIRKAAIDKPFLYPLVTSLSDRLSARSMSTGTNPRIARETAFLLMEMATLSHMPEASKCELIEALYLMDAETLQTALSTAKRQLGETGAELAHRVIASAIEVYACSLIAPDSVTGNTGHLDSYQDRLDVASGKVKRPRLQTSGIHFRALLLNGDADADVESVTQAVRRVLGSNADFDDKYAVLEALDTAPLTVKLPVYIENYYFATANEYLNDASPEKTRSLPDGEQLMAEKKRYYKTLSLIHKKLPEDKVKELKEKTKEEYDKALNSTLPAVHAAIMNDNVKKVEAYLEAVLDPSNGLSPDEVTKLISMPHKGKSAFYRALIRGTPDMIRTFIETILASKLHETHKVDLLLARRESDNFGAFYIAMSSRDPERVRAFMEAVLASNNLLEKDKEKLLRCKKKLRKGAVANQNKRGEIWANTELYARSEAVRNEKIWASREQKITTYDKLSYGARKIPSKVNPEIKRDPAGLRNRKEVPSLVELFDDLIDKSNLLISTKDLLKDKLPSKNTSKQ
jgi:hypothetical protein